MHVRASAVGAALAAVVGCGSTVDSTSTAAAPESRALAPTAGTTTARPAAEEPSAPPGPAAASAAAPSTAPVTPPATAAPAVTSEPQQDAGAALWDTSWLAVERTRGGEPWPFVAGTAWAVGVDGPETPVLRWRGACNSTGAAVVVEGDRLVVSDEPGGGTAVGCEPEADADDLAAGAFFRADPTWHRTGDVLTLSAGGVELRLERATGWPPPP